MMLLWLLRKIFKIRLAQTLKSPISHDIKRSTSWSRLGEAEVRIRKKGWTYRFQVTATVNDLIAPKVTATLLHRLMDEFSPVR
jgi:hypothetical protein